MLCPQLIDKLEIDMDKVHPQTSQAGYNPDNLLDAMLEKLKLKNDAALSRALEVAPPVISKIRHRRLPVGASMLIRMHEVSNLSVGELREILGDRRQKYRISDVQGKPKQVTSRAE
jgi:plasmid maintenance system antidote protein VapI